MSYLPDAIDLKIITLLQKNARLQNTQLAKKIGMAPSAALERVKKLEQKGIIKNYVTRIDPAAIKLTLLAFIFIESSEGPGDASTARLIAKIPEVLEVHHIAGDDCYLVKIRTENTLSLIRLMREKFSKIPTVISTKTTIVLETLKEDNYLPVPKP